MVFGVRVVAFSGLMREIARRAGVGGRPLSRLARERVAGAAIARVRLEALAASAATPGFVQALLRLVSELEEQRIEPGRWWAAMRAWGEREPARAVYAEELARLYGAYRDALRAIERRDRVLHDQAALDALRLEPARWGATPVFLYGFDDLTAVERDAVETLAVHAGAPVTVALSYEPGRAAFAGRGATFQELMALGPEHVELPARAEHYARPALHALERTLFEAPAGRRPDPGDALLLLEGGGERAELELVAAHVARLIAEQGFAPEDIAVVLREPREHAALLAQVFGALEVPFALERTIVAGHTALGRGVVALLRCALADGSADDLLAWLRTPGKLARPGLADRLEQRARVEGAATAAAGARGCGRPTIPTSSCTSSTASPRRRATRRRCAGAWPPSAARCSPRRTAAARGCWPAPRRSTRASPARCARRWASSSAWRRWIARWCRHPASSRACCTTSRCALTTTRVPGSWPSRARARCAPGACGRPSSAACARTPSRAPPSPSRSSATTSAARSTPPPGCACVCARTASTPSATCSTRWSAARPSCSRSAGPRPTTRASRACARCSSTTSSTASPRVPRQRVQRRPLGAAGFEAALAPTENEEARARLAAGPGAPEPALASLRDPRVLGVVNARATWSASALEAYASCPVKWFVDRLLRPAALEPDPEPMLRGELAHRVLEDTLRALSAGGPLTPERLDEARALLRAALDARADDAPISPNAERRRAALRRLEADLLRYVEQAAHGQSAFAPREFELRFGGAGRRAGRRPSWPAASCACRAASTASTSARTAPRRSSTTTRARARRRRPNGWRTRACRSGSTCSRCRSCSAWRRSAASTSRSAATTTGARGACCSTTPIRAWPASARTAWRPRTSTRSCRRCSTPRCRRCAGSARARWSPTRRRAPTAAAARIPSICRCEAASQ